MKGWRRELQTVSECIVALCHERVRLQSEQVLHGAEWEQRLAEIGEREGRLLDERRELLKLGKYTV
jgi:hypothetical protein